MINSVLDSITHIHDLERDFKQIKSSGKYNELCKLLAFILNSTKISIPNFKIILEHTVDSILDNPLAMGSLSLPQSKPASFNSQNSEKPKRMNLKINTKIDDKVKEVAAKSSAKLNKEDQLSPISPSSPKVNMNGIKSPASVYSLQSKNGDLSRSVVMSVSFSSPTNEEVQKKLEKVQHSFSGNKLFTN